MTITYYIDDGYAGASRPQHVRVPDDEIKECESFEEVQKLIWDYIETDFQNKARPIWDHDDDKSEIENIRLGLADEEEE